MSKKIEQKSWDWACKNKLDPYSMGQAYGNGYEASVNDVVDWLQEHINDYLDKGRDIDLIFDDIREEFGLQPKFR